MQLRFGVTAYDDPMETLTWLKQVSSVVAYKGNFEILSNRITGLSESHKLSCFLSGLKDEKVCIGFFFYDILVFSHCLTDHLTRLTDHLTHLRTVLEVLLTH